MKRHDIESLIAEAQTARDLISKPALRADLVLQSAAHGIEELERSSLKAFKAAGGMDAIVKEANRISDIVTQMNRMPTVTLPPPDPTVGTSWETAQNTEDLVFLLEAQIDQVRQAREQDRLLAEKQHRDDRRLAIWIGAGGAVLAAVAASALTVILTLIFLQ